VSDGSVHLTFPASPEYLILARLALSGIARTYPVDEATLADLKLAVTEACGNAVRHAYPEAEGSVSVRYTVDGDVLEIAVEDRGAGLRLVPLVEDGDGGPQGLPEGGMGMAIIRAIVDDVDVSDGPDGIGTVVTMAKRLTVPTPPRDAGSVA
jgi:serine/threonine-protein kinase RsbW